MNAQTTHPINDTTDPQAAARSGATRSAETGRGRGRKPSPLRYDWMPLCVGKRRNDRQINHPELPNAQAVLPPHQRHA